MCGPGRDHGPKADDREPGIPQSLLWVTGFRVRLRFASALRNGELDVRCHMIDFMETLYPSRALIVISEALTLGLRTGGIAALVMDSTASA
jgi:hypothetical protein